MAEGRHWLFPLVSSSQGFSVIQSLVLRMAHRALQPISEKLVLTRRAQVTSHIPTLGPSLPQTALLPLLELCIPFCQAVLSTWASSQSHLWATLPNENDCGECYCWLLEVSKEGSKPWCGCCCLVQECRGQHLLWGSGQDCRGSLIRVSAHPQGLAPREGQPEAAGR